MFDNYELGGHRNEWYQNEIYMDLSLFEAFGAHWAHPLLYLS